MHHTTNRRQQPAGSRTSRRHSIALPYKGVTIELIGDSGSGKTTQAGELAKRCRKQRGLKTRLNTSDRGGYDSISHLEDIGILEVNELGPTDDPWIWTHDAVNGEGYGDDIGLAIFDSGTSLGDILLHACSHAPTQIGQQKTQRFAVNQGSGKDAKTLTVSINNEAHFGVVQGFMLEAIRNSTWLTRRGIDVLWTFALFRGEDQGRTPILGPKVAGKALTPFLPKEFKYTFRIDSIPQEGTTPVHRLYLTEHPELAGLGHSFGNARYPLGVTPLPPYVEPASLPEALDLIAAGHDEARQQAEAELL